MAKKATNTTTTQPRLKQKYLTEVQAQLQKELGINNIMAVPRLDKIVVNASVGKELHTNSAAIEEMVADMATITGQKPVVTKAKKAVSNFKIREGMDNGLKVTLRGDSMWYFLDKLISVVLPRVKDFRGVPRKAFDRHGNYALGIREHTVFPEIDTTKMVKIRSLQVIINTTATTDEQAFALLEKFGMPFRER